MKSSSKSNANGTPAGSSNGRNGASNGQSGSKSTGDTPVRFGRIENDDSDDLQKVRDLLFGSQSKQHEQDLQAQSTRMGQVEAQFLERLGTMEEQFTSRLKSIEASIREELQTEVTAILARLDDHGTRKVERSDLRSMLSDLANRIGD